MQDNIGQARNPLQRFGPIKVGQNGAGAGGTPGTKLRRIAQQGEDPIAADQMGHGAAGNISAADDQ